MELRIASHGFVEANAVLLASGLVLREHHIINESQDGEQDLEDLLLANELLLARQIEGDGFVVTLEGILLGLQRLLQHVQVVVQVAHLDIQERFGGQRTLIIQDVVLFVLLALVHNDRPLLQKEVEYQQTLTHIVKLLHKLRDLLVDAHDLEHLWTHRETLL